MNARPDPTTARAVGAPVAPAWLALLAGPLSFGITGPTLVLSDIGRDLGVRLAGAASVVVAFGWGIAVGTPLAGGLLARRGLRTSLLIAAPGTPGSTWSVRYCSWRG